MSLDHAILGFLCTGESSGYDLKTRCFQSRSSHFWTADQAQIYRTLDRLAAHRLVTCRSRRQSRRPDRRTYSITDAGRAELDTWLATAHPLPPRRDQFMIQLYFADELSDEATLALLGRQREAHQERLNGLRDQTERLAVDAGPRPTRADAFRRMTLDGVIATTRATIDWIDDCIETIKATADTDTRQRTLFPARATREDLS